MLKLNIKLRRGTKLLEGVTDYTFFLLGSAFYAFGFSFFPNQILHRLNLVLFFSFSSTPILLFYC